MMKYKERGWLFSIEEKHHYSQDYFRLSLANQPTRINDHLALSTPTNRSVSRAFTLYHYYFDTKYMQQTKCSSPQSSLPCSPLSLWLLLLPSPLPLPLLFPLSRLQLSAPSARTEARAAAA
jgi:hypothetical protein